MKVVERERGRRDGGMKGRESGRGEDVELGDEI